MPKNIPDFRDRFGYGGFISLEHHKPCCAKMMRDDGRFFREVEENSWDPDARLRDCDQAKVDVQVLSTVPVLFSYWAKPQDGAEVAKYLNDEILSVVNDHPSRFLGLATLPMQDPDLAIAELERSVRQGLVGIEIGTHVNDMNLNHPKIFPVFEACQDLGIAVFIHPWDMMGMDRMPDYWLPWLVGMPAETSLAICSMIFGGIFEKLPNLRVAFAHGGGSFPGTIGRIEHGFKVRPDLCAVDNSINPREYLGRFYVDSLVHDSGALQHLLSTFGNDNVMLGTDYPFPLGEAEPGALIQSAAISDDIKKLLLFRNAIRWLGLSSNHDIFK